MITITLAEFTDTKNVLQTLKTLPCCYLRAEKAYPALLVCYVLKNKTKKKKQSCLGLCVREFPVPQSWEFCLNPLDCLPSCQRVRESPAVYDSPGRNSAGWEAANEEQPQLTYCDFGSWCSRKGPNSILHRVLCSQTQGHTWEGSPGATVNNMKTAPQGSAELMCLHHSTMKSQSC